MASKFHSIILVVMWGAVAIDGLGILILRKFKKKTTEYSSFFLGFNLGLFISTIIAYILN